MRKYLSDNKNISKTILLVTAFGSVLAILVSCFVLSHVVKSHDEEMIKFIAADVYDDINNELLKPVMLARVMSSDSHLKEQLLNEKNIPEAETIQSMSKYLTEIKKTFKCSSTFIISDATKNYYSYDGLNKKVDFEKNAHDIWYKVFVDKNAPYDFDIDIDEVNRNAWTVFVNARLDDEAGNLLGVCGVGVDFTDMQSFFITAEETYNIKINLVDENGVVQVDTAFINIENPRVENVINPNKSTQFVLTEENNVYTITKYMPDFDWYLVVRRDAENTQGTFSNLIIYMFVSFLIASIGFLIFIQIALQVDRKKVEETAKKHGIASYADLYVSMHLIDVQNDLVHELSSNQDYDLAKFYTIDNAAAQLFSSVKSMTAPESLSGMIDFIDLATLDDRLKIRRVIHHEFLSNKYGWCKAYLIAAEFDREQKVSQIIFAIELIDEEKRRENQLLYLSQTDAMTGLRNRGSGEKAISALMNEGIEGVFFMLDADKFKSINDNYGHDVGDKVIKAIAQCLKKSFRNSDVVMRLGGDEFAAYALGVTNEEQVKIIVNRIFSEIDRIKIPELGDRKISVSVGSALFHASEACHFMEIYKRADSAVYMSKKIEGNCHTAYKN